MFNTSDTQRSVNIINISALRDAGSWFYLFRTFCIAGEVVFLPDAGYLYPLFGEIWGNSELGYKIEKNDVSRTTSSRYSFGFVAWICNFQSGWRVLEMRCCWLQTGWEVRLIFKKNHISEELKCYTKNVYYVRSWLSFLKTFAIQCNSLITSILCVCCL